MAGDEISCKLQGVWLDFFCAKPLMVLLVVFRKPMTDILSIGSIPLAGRVLLAPMASVTDLPFRHTATSLGAAYTVSEMVACSSLADGRRDMVNRAAVGTANTLSVIQLSARRPEDIAVGAAIADKAGADIIDINMGCPSREVVGGQSGAALMRDLSLARDHIVAVRSVTNRPVTVKMRLGWDDESRNATELAVMAESLGVSALTVHGRTRNQFYKGKADWAAVAEVKAATGLPVIVNGDIVDAASAREALRQSGADGVMVGRASLGRPWLPAAIDKALLDGGDIVEPGRQERWSIVTGHLRESMQFYGAALGLQIFRKHLAAYIDTAPWPDDAALRRVSRAEICRLETCEAIESALAVLWCVQ